MESLTVLDFAGKNIRFERRGDRVWASLTDMAKATGKLVADYTRSKSTTEFIEELQAVMGFTITETMQGGIPEMQGTWAIEEVAIDFAAWCNVSFRIWVSQQIRTLMTKGTVSITPVTHTLPQTYVEALKALVQAEEEKEALALENSMQAAQIEELEEDVDRLSELADELFNYSSIIRIAKLNNVNEKTYNWRKLKAASKVKGVEVKHSPCQRFGIKNLYHTDAWKAAYPEAKLPETSGLATV